MFRLAQHRSCGIRHASTNAQCNLPAIGRTSDPAARGYLCWHHCKCALGCGAVVTLLDEDRTKLTWSDRETLTEFALCVRAELTET